MSATEKFSVKCKHCGKDVLFEQPYAYHAGFADQGFLYTDSGTLTLVWSVFDPVFGTMFPDQMPWVLNLPNRLRFEKMLLPAPDGSRWRFRNPARCIYCAKPISGPMLHSIYYLIYPGSIVTDQGKEFRLIEHIKPAAYR
jgi:hypothetical protein